MAARKSNTFVLLSKAVLTLYACVDVLVDRFSCNSNLCCMAARKSNTFVLLSKAVLTLSACVDILVDRFSCNSNLCCMAARSRESLFVISSKWSVIKDSSDEEHDSIELSSHELKSIRLSSEDKSIEKDISEEFV